jgi:hypothetical protein
LLSFSIRHGSGGLRAVWANGKFFQRRSTAQMRQRRILTCPLKIENWSLQIGHW